MGKMIPIIIFGAIVTFSVGIVLFYKLRWGRKDRKEAQGRRDDQGRREVADKEKTEAKERTDKIEKEDN